jgi:heat-inducible transcriptional repressor
MKPLSPRQQAILTRVVDMHVESAQPVGSRQITELYTELYKRSYSSATVRYEMGTLEDLGYLTHPHTSAGRIPTDLGYRYYVDHSLQQEMPAADTLRQISKELTEAAQEIDDLGEKVSTILSMLSAHVGIVMVPEDKKERSKCYVQGSSRLLDQPEFQDMTAVKPLLKMFEDRRGLQQCFKGQDSQPVTITIGEENGNPVLRNCSVIAGRYRLEDGQTGTLALVGPRRMRYSRMVPLIIQMGRMIESVLHAGRF